jgi:hypothetical protein
MPEHLHISGNTMACDPTGGGTLMVLALALPRA